MHLVPVHSQSALTQSFNLSYWLQSPPSSDVPVELDDGLDDFELQDSLSVEVELDDLDDFGHFDFDDFVDFDFDDFEKISVELEYFEDFVDVELEDVEVVVLSVGLLTVGVGPETGGVAVGTFGGGVGGLATSDSMANLRLTRGPIFFVTNPVCGTPVSVRSRRTSVGGKGLPSFFMAKPWILATAAATMGAPPEVP